MKKMMMLDYIVDCFEHFQLMELAKVKASGVGWKGLSCQQIKLGMVVVENASLISSEEMAGVDFGFQEGYILILVVECIEIVGEDKVRRLPT